MEDDSNKKLAISEADVNAYNALMGCNRGTAQLLKTDEVEFCCGGVKELLVVLFSIGFKSCLSKDSLSGESYLNGAYSSSSIENDNLSSIEDKDSSSDSEDPKVRDIDNSKIKPRVSFV